MTKKDYILIAARLCAMLPAIGDGENTDYANGYRAAVNQVIGALSTDNPRFNVARFRAACGLSGE